LSVGDIAMDPGDPNTLVAWVLGASIGGGGGLYRSTDALAATPSFAQLVTDPDPQRARRALGAAGGRRHQHVGRHRRNGGPGGAAPLHQRRRELVRAPGRRRGVLQRPVLLRHRRRRPPHHGGDADAGWLPRPWSLRSRRTSGTASRRTPPACTWIPTPSPTLPRTRASSTSAPTAGSGGLRTRGSPGPPGTTPAITPRSSRAAPSTRWIPSSSSGARRTTAPSSGTPTAPGSGATAATGATRSSIRAPRTW
jgi:hypothetical protein